MNHGAQMTSIESAARAESEQLAALALALRKGDSLIESIRQALRVVTARAPTLRVLLQMDEQTKLALLDDLVDLASCGHSDISLCRIVIRSISRPQLAEKLMPAIQKFLARAGDDEEAYRRFAELLRDTDNSALSVLLDKAALSADESIREIVDDFGAHTALVFAKG